MSDRLQPVPGTQASRLPNLVGQTIGDDIEQFKLQKVIGRGSWGIVYLAHSLLHVGKNYAVKCIAHGDDVPDIIRETSAKELENHFHCQLYIPGVLKIHTLLQDDDRGVLFIVSEYCPDGDLLDLVLNKTFVGKDALIRSAFCQILDTVEAMHDLGVYHRDLKPDNIMCKDGGQTFVLGDFGFATEDETMTEFGMGSEPFMSPEVLGGLYGELTSYSAKHADIWALGVILMNLVCECLPWRRADREDRDFFNYLYRDSNYFYNNFPISSELNDILKSIFTIRVEDRASIKNIRKNILGVKTFFDYSDFDSPSTSLQAALFTSAGEELPDEYVEMHARLAAQIPDPPQALLSLPLEHSTLHPVYSDNVYLPDEPLSHHLSYEDEYDITDSEFDSDSDSDCDSEGPVTPEQNPIGNGDNITTLEDIEEFDLGADTTSDAGSYARFAPTPQAKTATDQLAPTDQPRDGSAFDKSNCIKRADANQETLLDTVANMWKLALGVS